MRAGFMSIIGFAAVLPGALAADKDPASLDRLADIVTLPPVSWWPPAFAWVIVIGSVLVLLSTVVYVAWLRRRKNAHRVMALAELERTGQDLAAVLHIAEILKRTALSTTPRQNVAALSGGRWVQWLNQTGNGVIFSEKSQQILSEHIYGAGQPSDEEIKVLIRTARRWVEKHQTNLAATSFELSSIKNK